MRGETQADLCGSQTEARPAAGDVGHLRHLVEPPRIAVVIPTFNRRAVLARAIGSVLRQEFGAFELVVVDDGSTDGSPEMVAALDDPRVRLLRSSERTGANAARNHGVEQTTAPLIAFLDSDDEFLPDKLGTVVRTFDEQPDLGTLVDSYAIVNPDRHGGRPEDLINPVIETSDGFLAALYDSTVRARRVRKSASGMTVRREIAVRAGLFDEAVLRRQDMEFLVRLAKVARCATTDRRLWIKHEQPESISFVGDGFIAATLLMRRDHPEYGSGRARLPADVVTYFWETIRRRQYARLAADVSLLREALGLRSTLSLIVQGARARVVDPRIAALFRR